MKIHLLPILFLMLALKIQAQNITALHNLPDSVYSGKQGKFHVQGVAVDQKNGFVYFSFTDRLVKTDLNGKLIGSVTGFVGHLGDLDFNTADGKIYGSLEYKNDAIGKGISKSLGTQSNKGNGFYIAIFDCSAIVRPDMNAEKEQLLTTVYLQEPVKDYEATVDVAGQKVLHRFGCSGIDGVAFAPAIGDVNSRKHYLYVAYGVYGDTARTDNDHQVLLKYDISNWSKYARPLSQNKLHQSGPSKPLNKYFVKTGATHYGIQNLAYDSGTGTFFAAVYRGAKKQYPNYDLFVIDAHTKPFATEISFYNKKIKVEMLSLTKAGLKDPETGITGWNFKWGATGLCPLGNGWFYISHNKKNSDGQQESTVYKYQWTGDIKNPFKN